MAPLKRGLHIYRWATTGAKWSPGRAQKKNRNIRGLSLSFRLTSEASQMAPYSRCSALRLTKAAKSRALEKGI